MKLAERFYDGDGDCRWVGGVKGWCAGRLGRPADLHHSDCPVPDVEELMRLTGCVGKNEDGEWVFKNMGAATVGRIAELEAELTALGKSSTELAAATGARLAKLERVAEAARPVHNRCRLMLADDLCDCTMEGGVHSCGRPEMEGEVARLWAALAALDEEEGKDKP